MKKIWSAFFVVLLSLIPLLGTNAEEMNPDDNVMFSESFEVSVQEIECVLYEDKFAPKKEIEAPLGQLSISEPDLEYAAGLIQPTMTSEGDFEVVNGILKKYNGVGGDVTIPNGVTAIYNNAFSNCYNLTSVTIPDTVTSIDYQAFYNCIGLKSISIPRSVTSIGWSAFANCTSLTSIVIPGNVMSIGSSAFIGCKGLMDVMIENGVTEIANYMFCNCTNLTRVSIPNSVEIIGGGAFSDCTCLVNITIPDSVKYIPFQAFSGCHSILSITIPESVTYIGNEAFQNCFSLISITINSPKEADAKDTIHLEDDAFSGCPATLTFHTRCETPVTKWAEGKGFPVVKTDHEYETLPAVPATATKTGLTEGQQCSVCGEILVPQQVIPKAEFHMTKNATKSVKVKESFQIVVDGKKVKSYKSDKSKVAGVSNKGVVTAKGEGTAKLTITLTNNKTLTLTVKVTDPNAPKKIAISAGGKSTTIKKGKTLQLTATVTRPAGAKATFTWSSSNPKVATVGKKNGKVKGVGKGTATITATTQNGVKKTIKIKVN